MLWFEGRYLGEISMESLRQDYQVGIDFDIYDVSQGL